MLEHEGDLVVPAHAGGGFATLHDAVSHAQQGKGKGRARKEHSILVRSGGAEEAYNWVEGEPLRVAGRVRVRASEGVELAGQVELLEGSEGGWRNCRWVWQRDSREELRAGMNVAGGSWHMSRCQLRGSEVGALFVDGGAQAALEECFVGGFGAGPGTSMAEPLATDGALATGNSTLTCTDCTVQHCGAWGGVGLRASGRASVRCDATLFFQNDNVDVSLHQRCSVALRQCSLLQHGCAAFSATLAPLATLRAANLTMDGEKWADGGRPGTLREDEVAAAAAVRARPPTLKRRWQEEGGEDPLRELFAVVQERAEDIISDWTDAARDLTNAEEAVKGLEEAVRDAGGTTERVETGRQRLRERVEVPLQMADVVGMLRGDEYEEGDEGGVEVPDLARGAAVVGGKGTGGEYEDLPPLLLATFEDPQGADATVCVYMHVEPLLLSHLRDPAAIADGDALVVEHSDRALSRRTLGGDAAKALAWIYGVQSLRHAAPGVRCNVRMVFDLLEEAHVGLLAKRLERMGERGGFLHGVDGVVCVGGSWLSPHRPSVVTSFRGLASVFCRVQTPSIPQPGGDPPDPLHSGTHGGALREPFSDLARLLASLHRPDGGIAVAGLGGERPLADGDREELEELGFDLAGYAEGVLHARPEHVIARAPDPLERQVPSQSELLGNLWRRPSLSIHGVHGGWGEEGVTTMMPRVVTGKFSVRTPPDMDPLEAFEMVDAHLKSEFARLVDTPNTLHTWLQYSSPPFQADTASPLHEAVSRAIERVHGLPPESVGNGGCYPAAALLQRSVGARGVPVVVLPLGCVGGEAEPDEEFFRMQDYLVAGVKVAAAVCEEVGAARAALRTAKRRA